MSDIIPKWQMTEEDIKLNFITPALSPKWNGRMTMETQITDGKINLRGNLVSRAQPKRADYVLYINANNPIAIVEAKDNQHAVADGLQQAMTYAQMLDVPFAYSSNGDAFREHDFLMGTERDIAMEDFPTPDELYARFQKGANGGAGLTQAEEAVIGQPYYSSQSTYLPRYYQRVAVNRTLDAIARGQNRILLVMATGTGKTYTAFQIVYRLLRSGMKKKILYLADRNILVDQSIQQDFAPLEKTIHKINVAKDDPGSITSYEVYFSLYQQLVGDDEEEHYSALFQPDFFDLVIVDECHRGSAKEESRWRRILEYFSSATQIGMTATTSKLLSTGADCKMTKLIVLDEMISSMTEFKQIIGRGTHLREKEGKTHFVVMDFRAVTRLFADPDWDGPIEIDEGFAPGGSRVPRGGSPEGGEGDPLVDPDPPRQVPVVDAEGCTVRIINKTVSVYDTNGKLLRQESIVDYTKSNILGTYASLDNFIRQWTAEGKKERIRELLRERGIDLELMKAEQGMGDVDDFDFICHVAFDKKPLTRRERADNVKKRDFLSRYSGAAREVLEALLDRYMNTGIYEIEKTDILKLDPFAKLGKPARIAGYFGGRDGYMKAVRELSQALYAI